VTTAWPEVALDSVATIERSAVAPDAIEPGTIYVGLENITSDGGFKNQASVARGDLASQKFTFGPEHVLYGKLRPYLSKIAAPDFAGVCSTDVLPIRPGPELDKRYLLHFLRQPAQVAKAASLATGANLPRLNPKVLAEVTLPLPPLDEQRRIAGILDAADEVRAKRRRSLDLFGSLTESTFLDMFDDPRANPMDWSVSRFGDLLAIPLRNGVSPSTSGSVEAQVLTLSAITGSFFAADKVKFARFADSPPLDKRVRSDDFLICRGNGNLDLVGRGRRALESMPLVAFPDTAIAARPDPDRLLPDYLECIWHMSVVRRQLESMARTTNGTHKVNQGMIESVEIPVPPIDRQLAFASAVSGLRAVKRTLDASEAGLRRLFASLQARAFQGEQ
jgi:type I restriction enzyme S subunit